MGKLESFTIEFLDGNGVYYGGSNVEGRVLIQLNKAMKMRCVKIKFKGSAYNHWTESRHTGTGENRRHVHVRYSSEEVYCNHELILWGGEEAAEMEAGSFQFPFSFQLPPTCPTSFEGTEGYIRYSTKATIDKPWKFDHTTKRAFTVVGVHDLNMDQNARRPLEAENVKTLGCCCCKSGTISLTVKVPKTGFVPGETMPVFIDATNHSNNSLKRLELKMVQYVRYQAERTSYHPGVYSSSHSERSSHRTMFEKDFDLDIGPGSSREWNGEEILIPPCPDLLLSCGIIHVQYLLQVNPSAPKEDGVPDFPPPSYGESVFGRTDIREEDDDDQTGGDTDWAPRYPVYDLKKCDFKSEASPPISL